MPTLLIAKINNFSFLQIIPLEFFIHTFHWISNGFRCQLSDGNGLQLSVKRRVSLSCRCQLIWIRCRITDALHLTNGKLICHLTDVFGRCRITNGKPPTLKKNIVSYMRQGSVENPTIRLSDFWSKCSSDIGSPPTKSIEILSQGREETGRGVYKPNFLLLGLLVAHLLYT